MAVEQSPDPDHRLIEALASFARLLVSEHQVGDVLYDLCDVAVAVTGATGAGVLLEDVDERLRYAAASDPLTGDLEGIQLEVGEGPCMLAHSSRDRVLIADLASEERFPKMVPRTLDRGMRAVFTFPLLRKGESIGILDLYRDTPGPLSSEQMDRASLLADMVTTAVLNRRTYDDSTEVTQRLQLALDARIVMEQAKGRVAAQPGVDVRMAEQLIYEFARVLDRPVGEVVRDIAHGRLSLPRDGAVNLQSASGS